MPNSQASHWAQPFPMLLNSYHITQFELKCQQLNLTSFEEQQVSPSLRAWVEQNMRRYYVPEKLLKVWDLKFFVDID